MGNKNSTPQRRNTDNNEQQLQYRTNYGPVPAQNVPQQLEGAPPPHAVTRSRYPREYRNAEGARDAPTHPFDNYVTGPGRSNGPAGQLHEYPIPTANGPFHFSYDRPAVPARRLERQIHPNERANVMGYANGRPQNDPKQTRGVVRVAEIDGKPQNVVVGVINHPPEEHRRYERAPLEPLSREGRQAVQRQTDEKGRTRTYPPRGLDSEFVEGIETKFRQDRQPAHPQMRPR